MRQPHRILTRTDERARPHGRTAFGSHIGPCAGLRAGPRAGQRRVHAFAALAWVIGLLLAGSARADLQSAIEARIRAADLKATRIAVMVMDVSDGRVLVQRLADEPMIPASNLKLFTSAAALGVLGPDFVFQTELRIVRPAAASPEAAQGDTLIVHGDGDPSFGDPKILNRTPPGTLAGTPYEGRKLDVDLLLQIWVDQVRKAGVKRIARLVIDDRIFDRNMVHASWPQDQLHKWYCAQVAGVNFYTNVVEVYAQPTQLGQTPLIRVVPDSPFMRMTNRASTGTADTFWAARTLGTNNLVMAGKVRSRTVTPIEVTVDDPPMYFGQLLADRLGRAGIAVAEVVRPAADEVLPRGQLLHTMRTPIAEVLSRCNKDSQNLYAEALFKRMGRQISGSPGSWSNGAAAVRIFLRDKLGTRAARVQPVDGSGLSRDNLITAHVMVDLLNAMHQDAKLGPAFRNSLAVAGQDGTLERQFNGDLDDVVMMGKTGYIDQVRTLSGYIRIPARVPAAAPAGAALVADQPAAPAQAGPGRTVAFSLLFNDIKPPVYGHHILKLRDEIVQLIADEAR